MVEAEIAAAMPRPTTSPARSGQDHRDSGTPVSAGSWQASALTSATCTGVNRGGRPDRRRSASPARPSSAYRPRQGRTVSTVTPRRRAILALE